MVSGVGFGKLLLGLTEALRGAVKTLVDTNPNAI